MSTGSAIVLQDDDTLTASGIVRGDSVGSLFVFAGGDTLSATGKVHISGSASLTQTDRLSATGRVTGWTTVPVNSSSDWTQQYA